VDFPVEKVPPKSRFYPKKDQKRRKQGLRDAAVARKLLTIAPHLDKEEFRPVILSFARVSNVTTDVYKFLRKNGLVGEDGEIRRSVDTLTRLMGVQLKLANALNLTPGALTRVPRSKGRDFAAVLVHGADEPEEATVVPEAEVEGE
jgi:hypothetical protein